MFGADVRLKMNPMVFEFEAEPRIFGRYETHIVLEEPALGEKAWLPQLPGEHQKPKANPGKMRDERTPNARAGSMAKVCLEGPNSASDH